MTCERQGDTISQGLPIGGAQYQTAWPISLSHLSKPCSKPSIETSGNNSWLEISKTNMLQKVCLVPVVSLFRPYKTASSYLSTAILISVKWTNPWHISCNSDSFTVQQYFKSSWVVFAISIKPDFKPLKHSLLSCLRITEEGLCHRGECLLQIY